MASPVETTDYNSHAFDRGAAPVLRLISIDQARNLVAYRGDESLQRRIEELAGKSNEGELTAAERAEYDGYVRANRFVALLQSLTRKYLSAAGSPE